ncbi:MAG: efflux RND transporter periplasmic adaptor subunit [Proteobacteria bacterium]|nr:efflux RND transporter periplasmic adaptor subunit [Pseudomonadota bacterium]
MSGEEERPVREELEALRISRGDAPPRRPVRLLAGAVAGLVLAGLAWLLLAPATGGDAAVRIAYAERSGEGSGAAASPLTGSGYIVTGDRYISLGVRVPGRVAEYLVEEGESVASGQALVRLDDRQYRASLREARAAREVASANVELRDKELARLRELRRQDFASEAELDIKRNELSVSRAEVQRIGARISRLELDLEDTVVRAPAAGVILEKFKEVGEMATPGGFAGSGELIRMANLEEMRAEVEVSETDLARVWLGQPAQVIPDAYPESRYAARVVKLYPQINRQKGTLRVEVRIDVPDEMLRPDMSARIDFLGRPAEGSGGPPRVTIPREALRGDERGAFVWQVRDGRARRHPVRVDASGDAASLTVAEGLGGGEALVVGDAGSLRDGQPVEIRQ